jgi:hypothetical protein
MGDCVPRARDLQNTTGGNRVGEKEQSSPLVAGVRHLNDKKKAGPLALGLTRRLGMSYRLACLRTLRLTLVFPVGRNFSSCAYLLGTYTLRKSSFGGSTERIPSFVGRVTG